MNARDSSKVNNPAAVLVRKPHPKGRPKKIPQKKTIRVIMAPMDTAITSVLRRF